MTKNTVGKIIMNKVSVELNKFLNTNINEKQKAVNSKNPIISNNKGIKTYPKNYYINFTARNTLEIYEDYKDTINRRRKLYSVCF